MRTVTVIGTLAVIIVSFSAGCTASGKTPIAPAGDAGQRHSQPPPRARLTAANNPTSLGGRGEPSLEDPFRPATWVYLDGQEGRFIEREGNPQVQWLVDGPISATPTFRIEAYGPLLGAPRDFSCALDTVESTDGSTIAYAIKADEGTFEAGRDYSLLEPGSNFTIRNRITGDAVSEIAPLAPGTYLLAAAVKNLQTDKEGLAITYFVVGEDPGE